MTTRENIRFLAEAIVSNAIANFRMMFPDIECVSVDHEEERKFFEVEIRDTEELLLSYVDVTAPATASPVEPNPS